MAILQARVLEWVAMPSSRESSQPKDQTSISCLLHWQADCWPLAPPGKAWDSTKTLEELPSLTLSSPCLSHPCPAWGLSLNWALDSTESDIFPSHYLKRNFSPACCMNNKINSLMEIYIYIYIYIHIYVYICNIYIGFPGGLDGKESTCNAGDLGLLSGLGRSPGGGHGNPLQCSCLENPMDRCVWWAAVCGITKCWTWLSDEAKLSNIYTHMLETRGNYKMFLNFRLT